LREGWGREGEERVVDVELFDEVDDMCCAVGFKSCPGDN